MKKLLVVLVASITLCLFALTGCASKPSTSDLMRSHAAEAKAQGDLKDQLAKDWDKGTKLVATGEKRVKDGEKRVKEAERDLKRGQDDIARGKKEISDGLKLINDSERGFLENFPEMEITK